jgi:hypothetical protein
MTSQVGIIFIPHTSICSPCGNTIEEVAPPLFSELANDLDDFASRRSCEELVPDDPDGDVSFFGDETFVSCTSADDSMIMDNPTEGLLSRVEYTLTPRKC